MKQLEDYKEKVTLYLYLYKYFEKINRANG